MAPAELWKKLDTKGVDVIVASACVQMPSLPAIEAIENKLVSLHYLLQLLLLGVF